jgi:hypothetical protein
MNHEFDEMRELVEIRSLLERYISLGDRKRVTQMAQLFTMDGVLETASYRFEGRQGIIDGFTRPENMTCAGLSFMRHHMTTCDITVEGPLDASARSYFLVITDTGLDRAGMFVDRFCKEHGTWRIAHRCVRTDWISPESLMPLQPTFHQRPDHAFA